MDLQTLRFFVAAAETGSFSAAAETLQYAQSNLSSRMKQLEEELNTVLFYRDKRGVSLTSKGTTFYEYAKKILSLSDEATIAMKDMEHPCGRLAIGSIEATAFTDLSGLLQAYRRENPDVRLSLQVDLNDVFIKPVLDRQLDGAFIAGPVTHPELSEIVLKREQLVLVGSMTGKPKTVSEILEEAPLITFPEGSVFRRHFELLLASRHISYQERLTFVNSLGAMISTIAAGIGYGYLPHSIVESYVRQGVFREVLFDDPYSDYDVEFVYRRDHIMDEIGRASCRERV